jgi:hypothetical protein
MRGETSRAPLPNTGTTRKFSVRYWMKTRPKASGSGRGGSTISLAGASLSMAIKGDGREYLWRSGSCSYECSFFPFCFRTSLFQAWARRQSADQKWGSPVPPPVCHVTLDTSDILADRFDRTVELSPASDKHVSTFSGESFCGCQTDPAVSARNKGLTL